MDNATKAYREAISYLRDVTQTSFEAGIFTILIRAAVLSPAAGEALCKLPLRTKPERRAAMTAAAAAVAAEQDAAGDNAG